ncbi:MucR family transcriptional regulator [Agrobacterium pusense]|uniref:MucR family transcriptional regulatory protein y4pD n=1 Tax=Agrobacterium pusense TaxID=648995 RepID=U4Q456_9HYPH|nr:MucR family transcriptional regulator [Agrobacterium pusense]CDI12038.1 putative MucR family transcriptional regulatory protein y4pD [Agrobacterium pusense]
MTRPRSNADERQLKLTGNIVAAYLIRNIFSINDLPHVIQQAHAGLRATSRIFRVKDERRPAVPISKLATEDFIICLEDGKKFKRRRRHLMAKYGLTSEQHRRKWRLPADYPIVAASYARQRSKVARASWVGQGRAGHPPSARAHPFPLPSQPT